MPYLLPLDGAIELVFNTYEGELKKWNLKIRYDADLVRETQNSTYPAIALLRASSYGRLELFPNDDWQHQDVQ
jgi:hypothetical protein